MAAAAGGRRGLTRERGGLRRAGGRARGTAAARPAAAAAVRTAPLLPPLPRRFRAGSGSLPRPAGAPRSPSSARPRPARAGSPRQAASRSPPAARPPPSAPRRWFRSSRASFRAPEGPSPLPGGNRGIDRVMTEASFQSKVAATPHAHTHTLSLRTPFINLLYKCMPVWRPYVPSSHAHPLGASSPKAHDKQTIPTFRFSLDVGLSRAILRRQFRAHCALPLPLLMYI